MKNNKKKILITIILIAVLLVIVGLCYFKFSFSNSNSLSLEENKWIEENKYDVVDIAILNDIPALSYDGDGLIYDYLDYVTENNSLKFNVVPYKLDVQMEYDYKMDIVNEISKKDIEILKDNLILLTSNSIQYNDISEINSLRIGILNSDKQLIENYLDNSTITYVEYNTYNDLKKSIIDSKLASESAVVDGIIITKTIAVKELIENDLNVAYHFNDLNKYFVIKAEGTSKLNNILKKTFNAWKSEDFDSKYNEILISQYYKFKNLSDVEQKTLKSKSYVYGFIDYGIYNYLDGNKISGLNGIILKEFNKFSGLSITYTQYNSLAKLITDFNDNKIDFSFDLVNHNKLKNDTYNTINVYDKKLVIASNVNSNIVIDNLNSLKGVKVLTLKDSYIEEYLEKNQIKFKLYNNLNELVKDFNSNDILIMELENYNFYKSNYLENSRIDYIINLNEGYSFVINEKKSNNTFKDLFNFYLSFNSINRLSTVNYKDVVYQKPNYIYILVLIIVALLIYIALDFYNHIKVMIKTIKKSKKIKLTKEEKIMYIDQLTSLKNRNYLNSKIESWDESEVYPQSIIVIDLNNISYVNDNYGREEGDKVITEAANILIQNQLTNSEIIRTDGNEFLIYLVGYTEKQVISYLRKLSKEFKGLSHGFGAASGYSIITDAIKTIDDAVNEATLAMKENKEDINY